MVAELFIDTTIAEKAVASSKRVKNGMRQIAKENLFAQVTSLVNVLVVVICLHITPVAP